MRPLRFALRLTLGAGIALSLGCGPKEADPEVTAAPSMAPSTEATDSAPAIGEHAMDHHGMSDSANANARGQAVGTLRSLDSDARYATIAHGPFSGDVSMGAMTMGFDVLGDVDLSGLSEGDQVAFEVKVGRDGSYRISAICATATESADCLAQAH